MTQHIDRRLFLQASGASVVGAGIMALAACAPAANGPAASGPSRVRTAWWGGDVRHAKFNEIYDLFEAQNEGVTIEREFADWGSYWERLPTQFAGRNAPDVFHVTERQVADYASRGQIADLEALADQGYLDLSYFSPLSLDAGRYNDRLVMLLVGATIPATMYNQTVFENAGVATPENDWNWNDLYSASEQLAQSGIVGSTYQAISTPLFDTFLNQNGKSLFAPDASPELNFAASDAEEWFILWKDMQDAGLCQSAESAAEEQGAPFEDTIFARGQAALHVQNSNQLVTFQTAIGAENQLRLSAFPQMGARQASLVIGSYVCVNEGSEVKEDAARVVDFFVNDSAANRVFGLELGTPGNSNWADAVSGDLAEVDRRVLEFADAVENQSIFATPRPAGSARGESLLIELGLAVGFGQLTPAEASTRLVDELSDSILQAS